MSLLF
jgi:hypothetical protein